MDEHDVTTDKRQEKKTNSICQLEEWQEKEIAQVSIKENFRSLTCNSTNLQIVTSTQERAEKETKRTTKGWQKKKLIPRRAQETHILSTKKWTSEGWDYILSSEDNNESDEFLKEVDPIDQQFINELWEDEKSKKKSQAKSQEKEKMKKAIYHPVASPFTFSPEDEPMMMYGSMCSAMKKDHPKYPSSLQQGWNSSDDRTPDASDIQLTVEFSPDDIATTSLTRDDKFMMLHKNSEENSQKDPMEHEITVLKRKELQTNDKDQDSPTYYSDIVDISSSQDSRNACIHCEDNSLDSNAVVKEENEIEVDNMITSEEAQSTENRLKNGVDMTFEEIQRLFKDNTTEPRSIEEKIAIVDQCMQAISKISRDEYQDLNSLHQQITDEDLSTIQRNVQQRYYNRRQMQEFYAEERRYNGNNEHEETTENDNSRQIKHHEVEIEERRYNKKQLQQRKNSIESEHNYSPKDERRERKNNKRKISKPTFCKPKKIRRFTTLKSKAEEKPDGNTTIKNVTQKKKQKKFVAATPNSRENTDEKKKVRSIQTDLSFKTKKTDKYKVTIRQEQQEKESEISTPPTPDGPLNDKATQTPTMQQERKLPKKRKMEKRNVEKARNYSHTPMPRTQLKQKKSVSRKLPNKEATGKNQMLKLCTKVWNQKMMT